MDLSNEIKDAARKLGQALREEDDVHAYLTALQKSQVDPYASALEKQMYDVYERLIARQQAGEELSREDTRVFYELRQRVQNHPLISKRHEMLRFIRPYLSQVAEEISFVLGVDFVALARPQ